MIPKVSPNSSLKPGPTTPAGKVWRMLPTLLRTVIPDVRHFAGRRAALQVDEGGRAARAGEAAQEIEVRGLLEGLLDAVRHLIERLLEGGAGPAGPHDHGAEGECRILVAAKAGIEQRARDQKHEHAIHDKG